MPGPGCSVFGIYRTPNTWQKKILHSRRIIRRLGRTAVDAKLIDGAASFLDGVLLTAARLQ